MRILIILIFLSSCSSIGKFQKENQGAGCASINASILSPITGGAGGCITLESPDGKTCVKSLSYDSETNTCSCELEPCQVPPGQLLD